VSVEILSRCLLHSSGGLDWVSSLAPKQTGLGHQMHADRRFESLQAAACLLFLVNPALVS